jgi:translation initiation factor 1 (eIF-1/SUI1)
MVSEIEEEEEEEYDSSTNSIDDILKTKIGTGGTYKDGQIVLQPKYE